MLPAKVLGGCEFNMQIWVGVRLGGDTIQSIAVSLEYDLWDLKPAMLKLVERHLRKSKLVQKPQDRNRMDVKLQPIGETFKLYNHFREKNLAVFVHLPYGPAIPCSNEMKTYVCKYICIRTCIALFPKESQTGYTPMFIKKWKDNQAVVFLYHEMLLRGRKGMKYWYNNVDASK